ncbi:MAG: dienelactone hydrolase family protein, partial [Pirellulaceae bacterium]|nr:dienelactone hydrolase family protein [Pirellulaceae bacterium]
MRSTQISYRQQTAKKPTHGKKYHTRLEQLEQRLVFSSANPNVSFEADLSAEFNVSDSYLTMAFADDDADLSTRTQAALLGGDVSTDGDSQWGFSAVSDATEISADLVFSPDSGIRLEGGTVPEVGIDPESGTVYLYHSNGPDSFVALSDDGGLNFTDSQPVTNRAFDPRGFIMPQADEMGRTIWRKFNLENNVFASAISYDGSRYSREDGIRFDPPNADIIGVYTNYITADNRVALMYIGDKGTSEASVRLAYSTDNGETFELYDDNPLNDLGTHDDGLNQRDPAANVLEDGRIRVFTMVQGGPEAPLPGKRAVTQIESFTSTDDGLTFTHDDGIRLSPADFTEFDVWSLNDPSVIQLPDGRYRLYVAALITEAPDATDARWVIVSATTSLDDSSNPPGGENPETITVQRLEDGSWECRPAGEGPFPAVLYNHGGLGTAVGGDLQGTCEALAEAGYFARSEQRPASVSLNGQLEDVLQGLDELRSHPDVDPERVAVAGFSRGGLLALQAAIARPDEIEAVLLFAPAPGQGSMEQTLLNVSKVQAPVRIHIAENDGLLPLAQEVESALQGEGKDVELIVYPSFAEDGHDLFAEVREPYWSQVLGFLNDQFNVSTEKSAFVLNEAILGRSDVHNSLKGMSVVADDERQLGYVTGIMTDAVSVVDLDTGSLKRTFYLTDHVQATKKLAFDPVHRQLWAVANKREAFLWLVDPDTETVLNSRDIREDISENANSYPIRDVTVDPQSQQLYTLLSDVQGNRVVVYDTTLQIVDELLVGRAIVDIEWDVERNTLVALSAPTPNTGQPAQVLLLPNGSETDQQTFTPDVTSLSSPLPPAQIAVSESGDLFLAGETNLWKIDHTNGTVVWHTNLSFQVTELSVSGDQVGVLHQYGAPASPDIFISRLSTHSTETGELIAVRNGRYEASRMDATTQGFLVGNGGDASVSIFSADTTEPTNIQVGSAAEDVLVTPDGNRMLVLNRLGGSQLIEFHLDTGASRVLDTVPWPVRMVQRPEDSRLFIFSHFAPTVEVRDLETLEVLGEISLAPYGVGTSYSDTLSDMSADPNGDLLVALQCEQGKVSIIDGATQSVLAVVDLGGLRRNDGPGRMNAAVDLSDPDNRRVFVFLADDNRLYRLEESNNFVPRVDDSVSVSVDHQVQKTYGFRSVYYSPSIDKVFVWNVAVDPDTLTVESEVEGVERLVGEAGGVLF